MHHIYMYISQSASGQYPVIPVQYQWAKHSDSQHNQFCAQVHWPQSHPLTLCINNAITIGRLCCRWVDALWHSSPSPASRWVQNCMSQAVHELLNAGPLIRIIYPKTDGITAIFLHSTPKLCIYIKRHQGFYISGWWLSKGVRDSHSVQSENTAAILEVW